jgi:hypothetical protein
MSLAPRDMQGDQKEKPAQGDTLQETLLALMGGYPEARAEAKKYGVDNLFDGDYLVLARMMLSALSDNDDAQALSRLTEKIEAPELRMLLSRMLVSDEHMADVDWRKVFDNCKQSREKRSLSSMRDIAARLAVLDPNSEEYAAMLRQADALRTRKSKL